MRFLAILAVALTLVGCGPTSSQPRTSGSPQPSVASGPAQSSCRELDLRLPSGDALELSGTWLGNDGSYWTFTQVGDCVWATATDRYTTITDTEIYWQIYLRGTLLPDFTIPVEYAYSPLGAFLGPHYGHAVLAIEFAGVSASDELVLRKVAGCTGGEGDQCPSGEGTLQTTLWTRVSPTVILPPPTPEP